MKAHAIIRKALPYDIYHFVKYKKLLAYLKRQNIDVKVLTAEVESHKDDEDSSNEGTTKERFLMARTYTFFIDEGRSNGLITFDVGLTKVA